MEYNHIPCKKVVNIRECKQQIFPNDTNKINTQDLEISMQKFNPSTSPPENSFMNRLHARNMFYTEK